MTHTPTPTPPPGDDGDIDIDVDFPIDELVAALINALEDLLFGPFIQLGDALLDFIVRLMMKTPDVYPNPAVQNVHHDLLLIAFSLIGIALMATGLVYMTGPIFGITYRQARMVLPRLFVATLFATVAPQLLQLAVDFTKALTVAVAPSDPETGLMQFAGFTTGLVIVWIVDAALLLAIALLYLIRAVYILFVAAIAPFLAVAWAFPKARRYADSFIAAWFAALLIAPLNMLVLKFAFALMEPRAGLGYIPDWLLGIATLFLLILVPWQLYQASQAIVGPAVMLAARGKNSVKQRYRRRPTTSEGYDQLDELDDGTDRRPGRENPYRDYTPPRGHGGDQR